MNLSTKVVVVGADDDILLAGVHDDWKNNLADPIIMPFTVKDISKSSAALTSLDKSRERGKLREWPGLCI